MWITKYPARLIPKKNYQLISEEMLDAAHLLAKWVDSNVQLRDEDGKLSQSAIDVKRIPGFSSNKIPDSVVSDLQIKFKD
jgi:hypothetical protein